MCDFSSPDVTCWHRLGVPHATATFGWTLLTFFFWADGLSKHVVLFKNIGEEVVTIGFVWRWLLHTPSAWYLWPLKDYSPPSGKQAGSVSYKSNSEKNKRCCHGDAPLSPSIRMKVCLFSWPYHSSLTKPNCWIMEHRRYSKRGFG